MKLLKQKQQGLTLLELMVVVAVIGVLSAFAIPVYDDYTTRVKVADGLVAADAVKVAIADYYATNGSAPADNTAAGLPAKTRFQTEYVKAVSVSSGDIIIEYLATPTGLTADTRDDDDNLVSGTNRLLLRYEAPSATKRNITWECGANTGVNKTTIPASNLPSNCRP